MSSEQVSGAVTFDMSGLAAAITENLQQIIGQVNENLERLAGRLSATALDEDAAVDVLAANLPVEYDPVAEDVAGYLAEHLAQAGYALVAVAGPALEAELGRHGFKGVAVAPVVDPVEAQRKREDEWFEPGRED